jgi:rRNA maturation endonuclease Nob1
MSEAKSKSSESGKESRRGALTYTYNFRCRNCFMVDGYSEGEKKCRWCGAELYEMDKI